MKSDAYEGLLEKKAQDNGVKVAIAHHPRRRSVRAVLRGATPRVVTIGRWFE